MSSKRLKTLPVTIGDIVLGAEYPIIAQTMTTTDTMDTQSTVNQCLRCIEAGAQMVRITAPSKKEAENLKEIKAELLKNDINTPLVADIHYTPNAAEIAAQYVEKVRVNPGNYVDKKKFEFKEYTSQTYQEELDRMKLKFAQLIDICKKENTAMRIGTNHGSLSDRIMSRYGDTSEGMVESAMEFLRIARTMDYHQVVLSMKSSNPIVMVGAYRKLVAQMLEEFGEVYPLHLGVTEAGDGEDGRVKSALGICTLLEDGIGDTIRVSLTEDPELEIPVCESIIAKYQTREGEAPDYTAATYLYPPRRASKPVLNIGGDFHSVVLARTSHIIDINDLEPFGYTYDAQLDKWHTRDQAVDVLIVDSVPELASIPENLLFSSCEEKVDDKYQNKFFKLESLQSFAKQQDYPVLLEVALIDLINAIETDNISEQIKDHSTVLLIDRSNTELSDVRRLRNLCITNSITSPIIWQNHTDSQGDAKIIEHTSAVGSPYLEGIGDGIALRGEAIQTLIPLSFSILQATRTRISKTEYISCPSCGRTLFDLQETTALIRSATSHLKGVKIAIMGCIVNGPGEMADADFGYVGSGVDKISLYKGQELVRRNIPTKDAVGELIQLLKEHNAWHDPIS